MSTTKVVKGLHLTLSVSGTHSLITCCCACPHLRPARRWWLLVQTCCAATERTVSLAHSSRCVCIPAMNCVQLQAV